LVGVARDLDFGGLTAIGKGEHIRAVIGVGVEPWSSGRADSGSRTASASDAVRAAGGEPCGGEADLARIGLQARAVRELNRSRSTGALTRPKQSAQEKRATTSFTTSAYWKFESTPLQR